MHSPAAHDSARGTAQETRARTHRAHLCAAREARHSLLFTLFVIPRTHTGAREVAKTEVCDDTELKGCVHTF